MNLIYLISVTAKIATILGFLLTVAQLQRAVNAIKNQDRIKDSEHFTVINR